MCALYNVAGSSGGSETNPSRFIGGCWLADWLAGWLAGWHAGWLAGWVRDQTTEMPDHKKKREDANCRHMWL